MFHMDLSSDKDADAPSLKYVAAIEEYYQTLAAEVDSRAVQLTSVICETDSNTSTFTDPTALAKNYNACIAETKTTWSWLMQASQCMHVHLENASQYHQFFHQVKHTDAAMRQLTSWLRQRVGQQKTEAQDPQLATNDIRDVLRHLLALETRTESLFATCDAIYPVYLRKEPVDIPLRIKALIDFQQDGVNVKKGEDCLLLENSEITKWKIRTAGGTEGYAPALVFLIPPPDTEAVRAAQRVRQQLLATWLDSLNLVKHKLMWFFDQYLRRHNPKEMAALDATHRTEVASCLDELTRLLAPPGAIQENPVFAQFAKLLGQWQKLLAVQKVSKTESASGRALSSQWAGHSKLTRQVQEFEAFVEAYKDDLHSKCQKRQYLVGADDASQLKYVSSAYIEKMKPLEVEDADASLRSDSSLLRDADSDLNLSLSEKVPSSLLPPTADDDASSVTVGDGDDDASIDGDVTTSQTIRETRTFTIVGVVDPRDGALISIHDAIAKGVISRAHGLYTDARAGTSMPIAEAMQRDLIVVEFASSSVDADDLVTRGVVHVRTRVGRCASYRVTAVTHPVTGDRLAGDEAMRRGVVDPDAGRYVNPTTGESMTLEEAIERGLMEVEEIERKESVDSNDNVDGESDAQSLADGATDVVVTGVRDARTGAVVPLAAALEAGLVDLQRGTYRDAATGEVMSLLEGIRSGAVLVRRADGRADGGPVDGFVAASTLRGDAGGGGDVAASLSVLDGLEGALVGGAVLDARSGRPLSLEAAVRSGALRLDTLQVADGAGGWLGLVEAQAAGRLDEAGARALYAALDAHSLARLMEVREFDADSGQCRDPRMRKLMSVAHAEADGRIRPDHVFYTDLASGRVASVGEAARRDAWDTESGLVVSGVRRVAPGDAMRAGAMSASVDPDALTSRAVALRLLASVDGDGATVVSRHNGTPVSVPTAVLDGTLDVAGGRVMTRDGRAVTLAEAAGSGAMTPTAATAVADVLAAHSLGRVIANAVLDPATGRVIGPHGPMTLQLAKDEGLLDPREVFIVDDGSVVALQSLADDGRLDLETGRLRVSGGYISIADAIRDGVIDADFTADDVIRGQSSLQQLLNQGRGSGALFRTPGGQTMPLKEAIGHAFVTPDSSVMVDRASGCIVLAGDTRIVAALVVTQQKLDWLAGIEKTIAPHAMPEQEGAALMQQAKVYEGVQRSVAEQGGAVGAVVERAHELLEQTRSSERDSGAEQQYQRLRTNTSDVTVRYEAVIQQLDTRLTSLIAMTDDLDKFDGDLSSFNGWLEGADDKMAAVKRSVADGDDLDDIQRTFEAFNESAIAQEQDALPTLIKAGNRVLDDSKEYKAGLKEYRASVGLTGASQPDGGAALVEVAMATASERLKRMLAGCGETEERISAAATKGAEFASLRATVDASLPQLDGRVAAVASAGGDPEALRDVTAAVLAQGQRIDELRLVGDELTAGVGGGRRADGVRAAVERARGAHAHTTRALAARQHEANAALLRSHDALHLLGDALQWARDVDAAFACLQPASLDRDRLNGQLQTHRVMAADIDNHKAQVDQVVEAASSRPDAADPTAELLDLFDGLISQSAERDGELTAVVQRLAALHRDVAQLEAWLLHSVAALKRDSSDFDHATLKDKIERLYQQKQKKQSELNAIKDKGRELIEDGNTGDKNQLRETLADVQAKWHDLTELLVQMISFTALREIDDLLKYLDRAENEINTAEPISTDPETLAVQLRDHTAFHDDLEAKRGAVDATIARCSRMLCETSNAAAADIKLRLNAMRSQARVVCALSAERLAGLQEALPLAAHFSETHADLQAWLADVDAETRALAAAPAEATDGGVDQVRKQQESAKMTQRMIEDHKPLVEDLSNTGQELMEMCTEEDASDIKEDIDNVLAKYDNAKMAIRERLNILDDTLRNASSEISDSLDGLLEELHYLSDMVKYADPIAANPDVLREQISENTTVIDDLQRRHMAIMGTREDVGHELDQETAETKEECDDLRCKLQDLEALQSGIEQQTEERGQRLAEAAAVADGFHLTYRNSLRALQDINDNIASQDSPGIDTATIGEQQHELQAIRDELSTVHAMLGRCEESGRELGALVGPPGRMQLRRQTEDVDALLEEIGDGIGERDEELATALSKAGLYDGILQSIAAWLPMSETKLRNMLPVAADPRSVRIQIEELKSLKRQVQPSYVDIERLVQYANDLKTASPVTAESLNPQVKEISERWNNLLTDIHDRERRLKDEMVHLGEVDLVLEEVSGFLQQTEYDLQQLDDIYGDPRFIETHLKNVQVIQRDVENQDATIAMLNEAVGAIVERGDNVSSPLRQRLCDVNDLYQTVHVLARDKQNQLHDVLREVKGFTGDVEDLLRWLNNFRYQLRSSAPMGALPNTAQEQFEKFMAQYEELLRREEEAKALWLGGEEMLARCQQSDMQQLQQELGRLKARMYDTRAKADRRKAKLEEHLTNVHDFHAVLKIHTDWLGNAEKILTTFKYPSKIVERIIRQMQKHREFKQDIESHREIMQNLDRTGTYLKYFGRKQDTVYIKNLLISIKLRWKKLVRRVDEKGRLLQQAHKEDKRFYDAWKTLCDWLEDGEKKLKKYTNGTSGKAKHDLDELRRQKEEAEHFQHELSARHPAYYSTMRLGRSLRERCTKADPEQGELAVMLDQLKNKWNILRSIVAQRQNKLDEALLSSGRITDALQSLLEWLSRAETYVSEEQPLLGDLDTINILTEQHKVFQQELDSRQTMVATMKSSPTSDSSVATQLDELAVVWERVNHLSDVREDRLADALKLAEEFNGAVTIVREWLPQVESELKFRSLPENEEAIVDLIEKHDRFQGELQAQQVNVERIKQLAQEILHACHPNAVRFVKYYLTITQTRWEQALGRSGQRSQRLQEALRGVRGNAALLEGLLAWLTEAHALLAAKAKDPVPDDLTVVEALVKEHLEFHEDLSCKNRDVEKLTKAPTTLEGRRHMAALRGSTWRLNDHDGPNPRMMALQTRWRTVWRSSVDRKKRLQDALDHLLELESFKNFDFDLWRQRYIAWIRAKKLRITDFFRRQDKDGDGSLSRSEFVEGMLTSKFPTNRTELNAVFDVFDQDGSGSLDYKEFVDALKPDRSRHPRTRDGKRPATDIELVHDEIEQQVSRCQCRRQFSATKVGEGKYKFGERKKICLVRFLNSTVMVRVGGGWVTLAQFLESNDPCKTKGRTNTELREQFILPEGASQARGTFTNRRLASTPKQNGSTHSSTAVSPSGSVTSLSSASTAPRRASTASARTASTGSATQRRASTPKTPTAATRGTPTSTPRSSRSQRSTPGGSPVSGRRRNGQAKTNVTTPQPRMRF